MLFDVILPLSLEGVFTYNIPDAVAESVSAGMRVVVPLGKKKLRTGILWHKHDTPLPENIQVKDIISVLDEVPVVSPQQLQLWEWMASYYMCTIGEVMKAALPTALKPESETRIRLNEAAENTSALTPAQEQILTFLSDGKEKTIDEISKLTGIHAVISTIQQLQEKGLVLTGEHLEERYRPKTETWLSLAPAFQQNEESLQQVLTSLQRAPKQQHLLLTWLDLAKDNLVRRDILLAASGENPVTLKALLDKQILLPQQQTISRLKSTEEEVRPAFPLNKEQQQAADQIQMLWKEKDVVLLHGVTGSGKTEIYIHLIQEVVKRQQQVLYLVPEIALTTQLTERLASVFGKQLGVWHSRFSDEERVEIYRGIQHRQFQVIIGVRSAVFLPFSNLGLIIVDEEHDASYKQQDPAPRYHARSAAQILARNTGAKILLGTATPSVETYYHATKGTFGLVRLLSRFGDLQLPNIRIVDMKRQYHRRETTGHFSDPLTQKIAEEIGKNKQVIVFQNRRGYSPWLECRQCAWVPKCVNCDVSLTLHKKQNILTCHYCGYTISLPSKCPVCGQTSLSDRGVGTEKVEDELQQLFPEARISRMDLDTTRTKHGHQRLIDDFAAHRTDILVGTQMVSKGLHFDDVSTVAVLSADTLLNQPDFRSTERAYQMLEQVSGRAGRKGAQGEVIIQTMNPDSEVLRQVQQHDYDSLYHRQLKERQDFKYPPFYRLMVVTVKHRDPKQIDAVAAALQSELHRVFTHRCSRVVTPLVSRIQNLYSRQIMLKIEASAPYHVAKQLLSEQIHRFRTNPLGKTALVAVDVDPY